MPVGLDRIAAVWPPRSLPTNREFVRLCRALHYRKSWLFSGHDESAQGHAILWSLIASAQRHEIDVQLYLRSVLAYLPALPPDELQNHLPDVWKRDSMAEQRAELSDRMGQGGFQL